MAHVGRQCWQREGRPPQDRVGVGIYAAQDLTLNLPSVPSIALYTLLGVGIGNTYSMWPAQADQAGMLCSAAQLELACSISMCHNGHMEPPG